MAPLIFEVVADFQMRAGSAVLESQRLQSALDGVSGSAQTALNAVNGLGAQLAASFGLGSLSAIGGIGKSVSVAEKFQATITNLSSIITSNKEVFKGDVFDSFSNRVRFSTQLLKELSGEANRLGIREASLFNTFKSIGFIGLQGGLQVDQIKKLASNVQLAAPITGLDPNIVGDQIFRLALQGVSGSPRLFKTLLADTQTFQQFKGPGGTRKFGQLDFAQRVQLLSQAFEEFAGKPEIIARQLNSLSAQSAILSNNLVGLNGALLPLGQVFRPVLIDGLKLLNDVVSNLSPAVSNLADVFARFVDTPLEMIADLRQLAGLRTDVGLVSSVLRLVPTLLLASFGFSLLAKTMLVQLPIIGSLITSLNALGSAFTRTLFASLGVSKISSAALFGGGVIGFFTTMGKILAGLAGSLGAFIAVLLIFFQTIRRAVNAFEAVVVGVFVKNADRISAIGKRFTIAFEAVIKPFQSFIENVGDALGGVAGSIFANAAIEIGEIFALFAEVFARGVAMISAILKTLGTAIFGFISLIASVVTGEIGISSLGEALGALGDDVSDAFLGTLKSSGLFDDVFGTEGGKEAPIRPAVVHTGDVIINNDIKEAFQPDRIAFTVAEQIEKSLTRGTTANGNSLSPGKALVTGTD